MISRLIFLLGSVICLFFMSSPTLATSSEEIHFLVLADMHFDPYVYCDATLPCPLINKLRHADASQWAKILAAQVDVQQQYRHDSNYALLTSALSAAGKVGQKDQIKFVMILGDFLGHNYKNNYKHFAQDNSQEGYRDFVKKTFRFLTLQFSQAFPRIDIYMTPGNNDSYQHDYASTPGGSFFADNASIWSNLMKAGNRASLQRDFPKAGYYAADLPDLNLRLIMLNTNLFSYKAKGKGIEKAAQDQLIWFKQQLQLATLKHQKVLIGMHIPDAIDIYKSPRAHLFRIMGLWHSKYITLFQSIIDEYAASIVGMFAGHLHSDWFHVLTLHDKEEVPFTGVPSISPVFGNNPGFKVYTYSTSAQRLEDFVTYYYPLSGKRIWDVAYGINQIYRPDCYVCPAADNDEDAIKESASLAAVHKILTTPQESRENPTWRPSYWCVVHNEKDVTAKKCSVD